MTTDNTHRPGIRGHTGVRDEDTAGVCVDRMPCSHRNPDLTQTWKTKCRRCRVVSPVQRSY